MFALARMEANIDRISRLTEQLRSPNKDKRYEACEWLRVTPTLTPEALAALEAAARDPDPLVADSASRAIALHSGSDTRKPSSAAGSVPTAPAQSFWQQPFLAGPAAAFISYSLVAWLALLLGTSYSRSFALMIWLIGSPVPLLLGLLCAALARFGRLPAQAAAIAGAVLGGLAGLFAALLGGMPE